MMRDDSPQFLSVEQVLELHHRAIEAHGGLAGLRDAGLLEAAVAMPRQRYAGRYLHEDLPAMAAAYHYHLAQNHAFHDGNKRVAALAALVFLSANTDRKLPAPKALERATVAVAAGVMPKSELAEWFRKQFAGKAVT